jgi:hypothetical protein
MIALSVRYDITPKAWPLIERWVADALTEGNADIAPEVVKAHVERGSMQLWLAWDDKRAHGCCVTEFAESVRGKCCNLVVVAGLDFERWRPLTATIKAWAREPGCVRLEAGGREGWTRIRERRYDDLENRWAVGIMARLGIVRL